jgi:hypothetical protein
VITANGTNEVTLSAAAQSNTGGTGADTVVVASGALTATGTYALAAGANVVKLSSGDNIVGTTISATGGGTWDLYLAANSSVTVDSDHLVSISSSDAADTLSTSGAGSETVTINTTTGAITSYTLDADVETWNVGTTGNGNNSVTIAAVGQTVTFGTGDDSIASASAIDALTGAINGGTGTNVFILEKLLLKMAKLFL